MKKQSLKKPLLTVLAVGAVVALAAFVILLFTARTYDARFRLPGTYSKVDIGLEDEGVVKVVSSSVDGGNIDLVLEALSPGSATIAVHCIHEEDAELVDSAYQAVYVTPLKTIISPGDLDFRGLPVLCAATFVFFFISGLFLLIEFKKRKKEGFFSHETPVLLGLGSFFVMNAAVFAVVTAVFLSFKESAKGILLFFTMQYSLSVLAAGLLPVLIAFSATLIISNVWLIRHEGLYRMNTLGIALAVVIIGGVAACVLAAVYNNSFVLFDPGSAVISAVRTVISGLFLYFDCMLFAVQYCCIIAARRKPDHDADFILVLGCKVKPDGTLYPLIRGRADKALEFYNAQKAAGQKTPVIIPSGGQGDDEPVSEAEAVRDYLLSLGVPEEDVIIENKSVNTLQNMLFSKKLIDERSENAKVVFSTTSYHVFRSGIFAAEAGLNADGIGSRTKWYFWPNAQIREFAGVLWTSKKLHILLSAAIILAALLISNIGIILNALI